VIADLEDSKEGRTKALRMTGRVSKKQNKKFRFQVSTSATAAESSKSGTGGCIGTDFFAFGPL